MTTCFQFACIVCAMSAGVAAVAVSILAFFLGLRKKRGEDERRVPAEKSDGNA